MNRLVLGPEYCWVSLCTTIFTLLASTSLFLSCNLHNKITKSTYQCHQTRDKEQSRITSFPRIMFFR